MGAGMAICQWFTAWRGLDQVAAVYSHEFEIWGWQDISHQWSLDWNDIVAAVVLASILFDEKLLGQQ